MGFEVDIATAVNRLNDKVTLQQAICEAISNSLEANAKKVKVQFFLSGEDLIKEQQISGFSIEDDGEGFTEKNRESFCCYMSKHKIKLGCRGVGRLTWLRIFKNVEIESVTSDEIVKINFDINFNKSENISIEKNKAHKANKTLITFKDIVESKSDKFDFEKLCENIRNHLLIKLLLLKNEGKEFIIELSEAERSNEITNLNIPELSEKEFDIVGTDNKNYRFYLHYNFVKDGSGERYLYYCANNRSVCEFNAELKPADLPNNDSLIMLLSSSYLDNNVVDERNKFDIPTGKVDDNKNLNWVTPISFAEINAHLKRESHSLLIERYPELEKANKLNIEKAINKAPHLTEYIFKNKDIVKSTDALLKEAAAAFEKDKKTTRENFESLLQKQQINPEKFIESINRISEVATRELGEYVHYRQQIIEALRKLSEKDEAIEELIHNLFMKKKTESKEDIFHFSTYDSNLWLLDDKFLSYSYAASDKRINSVLKQYGLDKAQKNGDKAPDLAMFYSNKEDEDNLTCVLVEIKPFGINADKKFSGLAQVRNYANIFYKNNPKIKAFWVYLITKIDDDFSGQLRRDGYTPVFSSSEGHKIFVRFFPDEEPPMYVEAICIDALIQDADARNKTFLDILKKHG